MTEEVGKTIPLKRLVPGLIIGPAAWLGPYIVAASLFLPTLIQKIDAGNKIELVALFSTCGMIVAAISNMVAGYFSDRTYSKYGQRTPWLLGGAFAFMLTMILASFANTIPYLLIVWMISQVALNFIVAPMVAWIDMAPEDGKATASSAYGGLGMALGNNGFSIFGAMLLGQLSDKYKLLKYPIALSTLCLAAGALSIFFFRNDASIWIYGLMAGLGMGIWNSLDNLLNLEVIPDKERVAFFLGVYNLGNTVTQAFAPVIAAFVISVFGFSAIFIVSFAFALLGGICIMSIKSVKR